MHSYRRGAFCYIRQTYADAVLSRYEPANAAWLRRELAEMKAVRGIRGAVTVDCDSPEEILSRTSDLLNRMVSENGVDEEDIIHIMFTSTPDITSAFPATAARHLGWMDTPLISAVEMDVTGSLDRCIRVLMTVHSSRTKQEIRHIYLGRAKKLRPDLAGPE